jgi:hypothetical protein
MNKGAIRGPDHSKTNAAITRSQRLANFFPAPPLKHKQHLAHHTLLKKAKSRVERVGLETEIVTHPLYSYF